MSKLVVDEVQVGNDSEADLLDGDGLNNYKGYFHNEQEPEERYYEYGAHFPYKVLQTKLEELRKVVSPSRLDDGPKGRFYNKIRTIQEDH
jgi:hypothetical protein